MPNSATSRVFFGRPVRKRAADRMQTGRFKVFRHLNDWFEEFRLYHRKDGRVFKERDDLMSATRYGVMSLRYARSVEARERFNRNIEYPTLGLV
jgi:Terminase RNaseH-like domain